MQYPRGVKLRPTRAGFAKAVLDAAELNNRIVVLGSDVTGSLLLTEFKERYPDRFISLGIAEQNAAAVAAGLALEGFSPIFATYATFSTTRALDQIRVGICYNNASVLVVGAHAGISVGPDGATHQALEDIAVMRALPNMRVYSPADSTEAYSLTLSLLAGERANAGPCYLRIGREPVPDSPREKRFKSYRDDIGGIFDSETPKLVDRDATILATGHMVWHSEQAALSLRQLGFNVEVQNVNTIKPLGFDDGCEIWASAQEGVCRPHEELCVFEDRLADIIRHSRVVVTVEEHQVAGGLGSAVAELMAREGILKPLRMVGIDDTFGQSGAPLELYDYYHLTPNDIALAVSVLLAKSGIQS